jgi:hypothetical protein
MAGMERLVDRVILEAVGRMLAAARCGLAGAEGLLAQLTNTVLERVLGASSMIISGTGRAARRVMARGIPAASTTARP